MIVIDLSPGSNGETLDPDTFSEIDSSKATQAMAETADPALLYPGMSLRALARASDPYHLPESLERRLAKLAPEFLQKIGEWATLDRH